MFFDNSTNNKVSKLSLFISMTRSLYSQSDFLAYSFGKENEVPIEIMEHIIFMISNCSHLDDLSIANIILLQNPDF